MILKWVDGDWKFELADDGTLPSTRRSSRASADTSRGPGREVGCSFGDIGCSTSEIVADAIEQGAKNTLEQLMDAALETFGKVVASLGTMWVYIPGPQFTKGEGSTDGYEPNSTVTGDFDTLLGYVAWIGLVVAVLSIIGFAILYMRARSSETGMDSLGRLGLVLGGSSSSPARRRWSPGSSRRRLRTDPPRPWGSCRTPPGSSSSRWRSGR